MNDNQVGRVRGLATHHLRPTGLGAVAGLFATTQHLGVGNGYVIVMITD